MKSPESYDYLVLNGLAKLFNALLDNFTFYATLPNLPNSETDFAKLLDTIPTGSEFFDSTIPLNYFSEVYGLILEAQKEKPLSIEIGLNNYKNATNWIIPYSIPKYTPELTTVIEAVENSQKSKLIVESDNQPISIPVYPQFPQLVVNNSLENFNRQVIDAVITTTIAFSQSTSQRISFGNWFSSTAFLYAYQTPENWDNSIISWDDVFNTNTGILKYINSYITVVSDMIIEIHISGHYNEDIITMLKSIPNQVIFPFYQKINASSINYILEKDQSITIQLVVPKNQNYVFGMQYQEVKNLLT
ncbi:hypothetical protein [Tenacibaculum caenipelagi]|uniref:Uncharacterized protein n=1 Tax=Tenacibaculum caenipelagi TaxID=1325435 RepID=A0A4R6TF91_9FLAO|nr:hypothetical protein [Tenacibaculum caenipelagi]TDQ25685.1 hypothetical protein DFQ07_2111 [Tenacibaculum caenipelagi]